MRLFYDPNINPDSKEFSLSEEESKHIIRVLRMNIGNRIGMLDGIGGLYTCEIQNDNPKRCELKVISFEKEDQPDYEIHVAVGPTKQMERIEWFVEKATEIGITEISLIVCANSERVKVKAERLYRKAISAMKQSHRRFLPQINEQIAISEFIQLHPNGLIAHCYEDQRESFENVFKYVNCPILIGPEGDFTKEEIELALKNGYKTITLGENRLRTETAALYACMQAKILTK